MLKCEINRNNKKLILLISTIFAIINIHKCFADETSIGKIIIKDGIYLANEYQILSTVKNNPRINGKAKICIISSREDYDIYCKPFIKIYYDKWVNI